MKGVLCFLCKKWKDEEAKIQVAVLKLGGALMYGVSCQECADAEKAKDTPDPTLMFTPQSEDVLRDNEKTA